MSLRPLSASQIRQLGIVRSAAFKHQWASGLVALPPDLERASKKDQADFWAHQEIAKATQRVCSSRDMIDDEYNDVMLHFTGLCGPEYREEAPKRLGKVIEGAACDCAPGCEYLRDMHQWLAKAGYKVGYAVAICKGKFRGETDFRRLSESQLKQLHDTVVNRCRAKLGLGDADNRNKKQRQKDWETRRAGDSESQPQNLPVSQSPVSKSSGPKSRDYVLKPKLSATDLDPTKIPF